MASGSTGGAKKIGNTAAQARRQEPVFAEIKLKNGAAAQFYQTSEGVMDGNGELLPAKYKTVSEVVEQFRSRMASSIVSVNTRNEQQQQVYNSERANRPDYELGAGVPWGNKNNRKAARRGALISRIAKRPRGF